MVATNAAGARTLKFGATREWVTGLDCIFADGSRAWIRRGSPIKTQVPVLETFAARSVDLRRRASEVPAPRVRKNSSGYGISAFAESGELIDLLVGSEGTLAIFVGVEVALCDVSTATASLLVSWTTLEGAVYGASLAREAGACACELLDRTFLTIAAERGGRALPIEADAEAVLLIEMEHTRHPSDLGALSDQDGPRWLSERASALERAFLAAGASRVILGLDPESEEALWALRHAASPILARLEPSIASVQVIEDGVVPPARLAEYVRGVRRALDRAALRGTVFGHAGDANVHVNALIDVRQDRWRERLGQLLEEVTELTASLGGTPSGEHGDGRLRTPLLPRFWPPAAIELFAEIKSTLDPHDLLNPGVKVWRAGAQSWDVIKYDRTQPLPTSRVARVLERVSRERAYDRSRLEMLAESV
jgi:FAD/FMN-containing dehydrogenase